MFTEGSCHCYSFTYAIGIRRYQWPSMGESDGGRISILPFGKVDGSNADTRVYGQEVHGVFSFVRGGQKIQVVASRNSVLCSVV